MRHAAHGIGRRCRRAVASRLLRRAAPRRLDRGFTLIETALATIIVGVGVLALVAAQQAFHAQNGWSTHASTALRLGNEIREMTLNLPQHDPVTDLEVWGAEPGETTFEDFDDLDDFDNVSFSAVDGSGPINAQRQIIPNMDGWAQVIDVFNVNPQDIASSDLIGNGTTDMMMVRVTITYLGPGDLEPAPVVTTVSWLAPK